MTEEEMKESGFEPETGLMTDDNSALLAAIGKEAFEKLRATFGLDGEFFVSMSVVKRRASDGNAEYVTTTRLYSDVKDGKEAFWLTKPTMESCMALAQASIRDEALYRERVNPVCDGGRA